MTELPLHDAYCDGLNLSGADCTLYFHRSDASTYQVELTGIDALQLDGFREGNIVSIFVTASGEETLASDALDLLYPPPHPNAAAEYHVKYAEFRRQKCSAIAAGELTFVEMQSSYGASLFAVCREVGVKES